MSLFNNDWQIWRKALHEKQLEIDGLDNEYWETFDKNGGVSQEFQNRYDQDRTALVDELEGLYAVEKFMR